jgi:hypothetical protein
VTECQKAAYHVVEAKFDCENEPDSEKEFCEAER